MSTSDAPEPLLEFTRRASLAVSQVNPQINPLATALETFGRALAGQAAALNTVIEAQQRQLGQQWAERIGQTLARALPSVQVDIDRALEALARFVAGQAEVLRHAEFTLDTSGLDHAFQDLEAWRSLDSGQRTAAARLLDGSYRRADRGQAEEVPDELVAELEETARDFARTQSGLLSPERQRQLFVYFCGLLVLVALLQASFTSDAADAVIDKTISFSPAAVLAMAAAGKAWDLFAPRRPEDNDGREDED
uniref:Uncharacterized protein n=1 Tax=Streptomyces rochei TaxID=1928 RepID=F2Z8M2_STRRO|nr:hypothetical protein [Streptomyces rochei]